MTQFSDQLSAVRQAQFEAQLDFFRSFTTRALDSASQLAALNVRTSRASVEQAAGAFKQLLEVRDPRDLFSLGSAAQGQWQALFSYGRELAGLAAGVPTLPASIPLLAAPAPTANVPTSYAQVIEQASIATDAAATIGSEIAAAAVDIGAAHAEAAIEAGTMARAEAVQAAEAQADARIAEFEAAVETAIADETPPAEPTALAKALHELSPKPASAGHPVASTVPLEAAEGQVELPPVTPPENIAPFIAPPPKTSRSSRRK
ncbi:phasin family protein [Massilia aerilata]|uniref:Phasin family protein n=1 Tax=Massilia aerilata TaxID=453817 RepID=A0ABW0RYF5_9BURK